MATTEILQFAGGVGANVLTQAQYAALTSLLANGFSTGTAQSPQLNKVWRQSSFIAAGIANFMVNRGISVPDDGNLVNLVAEIESALDAYLDKSVAGGTDVTLNPITEAVFPIIDFTGVLTANINVIVPSTAGKWIVLNSTTGAFTLTVKTAAGTGVLVPQGKAGSLFSDGVNVYSGNQFSTTATQHDISTVLATTEFVQKALQGTQPIIATAGGTVDAITASFTPTITSLVTGEFVLVRAAGANTSTTPTFTPNSGTITAKTIVKGNNLPLTAGDIAGTAHWILLQYDLTLDVWVLLNPATGVSTGIMVLADEKAAGQNGGPSVAGVQTRTLNTVRLNTIPGASLAANQFTLPAGTYIVNAQCPCGQIADTRAYLYNVTDAAIVTTTIGMSLNVQSAQADVVITIAPIVGAFTIASSKVFELRHYTQTAQASFGLGININTAGLNEVYSLIQLNKVA